MRTPLGLATAAVLALSLSSCGDDADGYDGRRALVVFAAASLTSTFEQLEVQFEDDRPDVDVRLSFAGSSDLVGQIVEGNTADVFASADVATMDTLVDADLVAGDPVAFATNRLTIAVPPGNPAGIEDFADLAQEDLNLVLCQPEVPCGAAAHRIAGATGVDLTPVSEVGNVKEVLAAVEAGEADAGLVYVTDVADAGDAVEGIAFDESASATNEYPIVVVEGTQHVDLAQQWVDFVLGDGQEILREAGFGAPAS